MRDFPYSHTRVSTRSNEKMAFAQTNAFLTMKNKTTQLDMYRRRGATEDILKLVAIPSTVSFSDVIKGILCDLFGFEKKGYDLTLNGKVFKVRAACYTKARGYMWQHLKQNQLYDYVIYVLVDFTDLRFSVSTKQQVFSQPEIFKQQGSGEGEGFWCHNVMPGQVFHSRAALQCALV